MLDVTQHCLDLVIGVDEAAASGPNHYEHGKLCLVEHRFNQAHGRSDAANA